MNEIYSAENTSFHLMTEEHDTGAKGIANSILRFHTYERRPTQSATKNSTERRKFLIPIGVVQGVPIIIPQIAHKKMSTSGKI